MQALIERLTWTQRIGAVFGATYLLIGAVGFAVTAGVGFAALEGKDLIFFELNPLHNIVHLGIGAALLYAALRSHAASRLTNGLIGGTYLLVAIVGTFVVEADSRLFGGLIETRSHHNILAPNHPDNLLHLASALVLIGSMFLSAAGRDRPVPVQRAAGREETPQRPATSRAPARKAERSDRTRRKEPVRSSTKPTSKARSASEARSASKARSSSASRKAVSKPRPR